MPLSGLTYTGHGVRRFYGDLLDAMASKGMESQAMEAALAWFTDVAS